MSSSPPKEEHEPVEKEELKPSPIIETPKAKEKPVEPFQDLNKPSVKAEAEAVKEIPIEDVIEEEKESTKDTDKHSAEGSKDGIKGIDLENKEVDTKCKKHRIMRVRIANNEKIFVKELCWEYYCCLEKVRLRSPRM